MELKTLCELHGLSGNEGAVRKAILEAAGSLCDDVRIDRGGNVICLKKGHQPEAPAIIVAAHMDEIGFIIVGFTDDGLLRFRPVGGIDPRVVISKWVQVGNDFIPGVIGAMAIHLQTAEDRKRVLDFDNLFIDIGAKDAKEAEKLCPLGSYAAFHTPFEGFGEGYICAKALDDRIGCYNLLRLLENEYPGDLIACFVTQEEVGLRGSKTAAYGLQAEIALVLEATAANDLGDVPERSRVTELGKGVAVSFMDGASIADRELFRQMLTLAGEADIPHQVKQGVTGGNDAGSFQRSGEGMRSIVLSVPCRYIHSGASVAKESDIEAQYSLAKEFLSQF